MTTQTTENTDREEEKAAGTHHRLLEALQPPRPIVIPVPLCPSSSRVPPHIGSPSQAYLPFSNLFPPLAQPPMGYPYNIPAPLPSASSLELSAKLNGEPPIPIAMLDQLCSALSMLEVATVKQAILLSKASRKIHDAIQNWPQNAQKNDVIKIIRQLKDLASHYEETKPEVTGILLNLATLASPYGYSDKKRKKLADDKFSELPQEFKLRPSAAQIPVRTSQVFGSVPAGHQRIVGDNKLLEPQPQRAAKSPSLERTRKITVLSPGHEDNPAVRDWERSSFPVSPERTRKVTVLSPGHEGNPVVHDWKRSLPPPQAVSNLFQPRSKLDEALGFTASEALFRAISALMFYATHGRRKRGITNLQEASLSTIQQYIESIRENPDKLDLDLLEGSLDQKDAQALQGDFRRIWVEVSEKTEALKERIDFCAKPVEIGKAVSRKAT